MGRFPDSYRKPEDFLEISLNNNTLYWSCKKLPVFFLRVQVNPSPTKSPAFFRDRIPPSRIPPPRRRTSIHTLPTPRQVPTHD